MNMGDDSKLVYDEVGERLTAVAGEAVDYFPFTDKRDERIAELESKLRLAEKWLTECDENYGRLEKKWSVEMQRIAELEVGIRHLTTGLTRILAAADLETAVKIAQDTLEASP